MGCTDSKAAKAPANAPPAAPAPRPAPAAPSPPARSPAAPPAAAKRSPPSQQPSQPTQPPPRATGAAAERTGGDDDGLPPCPAVPPNDELRRFGMNYSRQNVGCAQEAPQAARLYKKIVRGLPQLPDGGEFYEPALEDQQFRAHFDDLVTEISRSMRTQHRALPRVIQTLAEESLSDAERKAIGPSGHKHRAWEDKKAATIRAWALDRARAEVREFFERTVVPREDDWPSVRTDGSARQFLEVSRRNTGPLASSRNLRSAWAQRPDVKGQMVQVHELFIIRAEDSDKLYIWNSTTDLEIALSSVYPPECRAVPLTSAVQTVSAETVDPSGGQVAPGDAFRIVVEPCECLPFLTGQWGNDFSAVKISNFLFKSAPNRPVDEAALESRRRDAEKIALQQSQRCEVITGGARGEKAVSACMTAAEPYVDADFPPAQSSLQCGKEPSGLLSLPRLPWRRPVDFLKGKPPQLFSDSGVGPCGLERGGAGDVSFTSAIAVLAENPAAVAPVFACNFPERVGAHRLRLCRVGWWANVIVDDFLPCAGRCPTFLRSRDVPTELWAALLQKACAKLEGSYQFLKTWRALDTLSWITGTPTAPLGLAELEEELSGQRQCRAEGDELFLCSPPPDYDPRGSTLARLALSHDVIYSVRRVVQRTEQGRRIRLLQLRNPWPTSAWQGDWSPESALWKKYPGVAEECGYPGSIQSDLRDCLQWISWEDAQAAFAGGPTHVGAGILLAPQTEWRDVRWRVQLVNWEGSDENSGLANAVVELTLERSCPTLYFAAHQTPPTSTGTFASIRVGLLSGSEDGSQMDAVNWSHSYVDAEGLNGSFEPLSSVMLRGSGAVGQPGKYQELRPGKYYLLAQGNPGEDDEYNRTKELVLSLRCPPGVGSARAVATTASMHRSVSYVAQWGFLDDPIAASPVPMQVDMADCDVGTVTI
eukprot:TRINITY_DN4571_c4_g1_i1.p1 TRINITY_DN4571_c4_g1~~TRINITY_DN4571_c4_g1_i1.p1  ORF type:complete len:954 (+),score=305.81 TRINITY_DN4571_c4_g1_i1:61-2862(+)